MDLRSLISEDDKKTLENYLSWYSNADYPNAKADTVLAEWARVKEPLYHLLGDQFILEFPISYSKSEDDLEDDILNYIYNNADFGQILTVIDNYYEGVDADIKLSMIFNHLPSLASGKIRVVSNKKKVANKFTGKIYSISPNEKIFHALGKLVRGLEDPNLIEKFERCRIRVSQITNQRSLSGTMSLSIHPMDYVTMSDNDCGWDSCMNWCTDDGGDYRMGTVEMLNSPCVIVAYVKSSTPFNFSTKGDPHGYWNSKKWRELFIVEGDSLITEIKAYPYDNEEFTRAVIDKLNELKGGLYDNEIYYTRSYNFNQGEDIPKEDWVEVNFQTNENGMYNDFGCYRNAKGHLMRYNKKNLLNSDIKYNHITIYYSGAKTCMNCGDYIDDEIIESNCVICPSCGGETRNCCCNCGTALRQNYVFWSRDDEPYCEDCYYEFFARDEITEEDIRAEDAITLYLISNPEDADLCQKQMTFIGAITTSVKSFTDFYNAEWLHNDLLNGHYEHYVLIDEVKDSSLLTNCFTFIKDSDHYGARRWDEPRDRISYEEQIKEFCVTGKCNWSYARFD